MYLYLEPSWLDHPFVEELSAVEVDSRIHKVLDLGVNPNPRASPVPLHDGVARARVSTLGPILVAYVILSFQCRWMGGEWVGVDTPYVWVFKGGGRGKGDNFASLIFPMHDSSPAS
jgi:hypothetical protein